ncbi:uncharacterized protein LOC113866909 [Abrus precatorius]|uniref:Uncharacterized protein LOC113866909 n=1 Tax=Abrus precatorius TaxID=3816 RepID=A0A8B8LRK6_ABRPR|nr:uncharacterized protein LOC113866909 [Abrus precatorius]
MTRANLGKLHPFNPEIDRTFCHLSKTHKRLSFIEVQIDSSVGSTSSVNHYVFVHFESLHSDFERITTNMANRTLKELAAPDLRAFPFSLDGSAKDWLYYLHPGSITCWLDMKRQFLEKFFPASRVAAIRKDISGIRQINGETLHEYWERFKKLCASCPHHQISDQLLIQYFYEGLFLIDRSMIDAASCGALVDKTPVAARDLIANMAANAQQFGTRAMFLVRGVNEVQTSDANQQRMENRIEELTSLVRQMALGQQRPQQTMPLATIICGICSLPNHPTDQCSELRETTNETVVGIFPGKPFLQHIQSWLERSSKLKVWSKSRAIPSTKQQCRPKPNKLVKQMANNSVQFQHRIEVSIQNLQTQIGQLATTMNELKSQGSGNLPSQTVANPKNVSAITLRSGKELQVPNQAEGSDSASGEDKNDAANESDSAELAKKSSSREAEPSIPVPFPNRVTQNKTLAEAELNKEIMETFRKVEINIPLLEVVKQIAKYAKEEG